MAQLGHIVTEVTREKLRKINKGKKLSDETKEMEDKLNDLGVGI